MSERKYYWLKLRDDFFSSKRIKKLRNMAGGDTYCIIYLKLQLLAMKNDGIIHWSGLEDNVAAELALDLDEKEDDVSVTLMYLLQVGLAETSDNIDFFFPYAVENTGSETSAAKRMRDMRERNNVTPLLRDRYVEIEKEIEKDIEKDIEIDKEKSIAHACGEYGWVKLTDEQYTKLEQDLGEEELLRCIRYVDESAQQTGNKNKWKDWNLVIRKCSRDGWGKTNTQTAPAQPKGRNIKASCNNYSSIDLDRLYSAIDKI